MLPAVSALSPGYQVDLKALPFELLDDVTRAGLDRILDREQPLQRLPHCQADHGRALGHPFRNERLPGRQIHTRFF